MKNVFPKKSRKNNPLIHELKKGVTTWRGRWPQPNPNTAITLADCSSSIRELRQAQKNTRGLQNSKRNVLENILHHRPGVGGKMIEG